MLRLRIAFLTLAPLLVAAAVACGSPKTAAGPTQSPQAAASAPAATTTPGPTPPSPPQAAGTVVVLTPLAAGIASARTDCPPGWVTFRDTSLTLSVCAPSGYSGIDSSTGSGPAINIVNNRSNPAVPVVFLVAGVSSQPYFTDKVPLSELCKNAGVPGLVQGAEIHLVVAGRTWQGCHGVGKSGGSTLESLQVCTSLSATSTTSPRFLCATVNWLPQAQPEAAKAFAYQIFGTLKVKG